MHRLNFIKMEYMITLFLKVLVVKKEIPNEQVNYLENLTQKYPILSIEDGMDENDWDGWEALTKKLVIKFN